MALRVEYIGYVAAADGKGGIQLVALELCRCFAGRVSGDWTGGAEKGFRGWARSGVGGRWCEVVLSRHV